MLFAPIIHSHRNSYKEVVNFFAPTKLVIQTFLSVICRFLSFAVAPLPPTLYPLVHEKNRRRNGLTRGFVENYE
jgi:hypothetical protein